MKILDNLAINIANRVVAKNDEVMLLEQENERLKRDYDVKVYTLKQVEDKLEGSEIDLHNLRLDWDDLDKEYRRIESKYTEVKRRLKNLSKSNEKQAAEILKYAENERLLHEDIKQLKKTKVSERYKLLKEACDKQLGRIDTYEFISDESNRQTIIDNFSHNLSKWISDKNLTDTEVAKKLDTSRNIVGTLRTGKRAVNVNTIQKFDIELCEYFKCSVYELVTVKMEGKK